MNKTQMNSRRQKLNNGENTGPVARESRQKQVCSHPLVGSHKKKYVLNT